MADEGLLLQWKILFKDLKPQDNTVEAHALHFKYIFLMINLCETHATCESQEQSRLWAPY